jgi:hypothetical protein
VLSPLAQQWQGDPAENPFAQAIRQIEARTRPDEPNGPDTGQGWPYEVWPGSELEPVLTGTITDAETGEPIPDVTVSLMSNRDYSAITDSNGVYVFGSIVKEGSYSIYLYAPEHVAPPEWEASEYVQIRPGEQVVRDYVLERGGKLLVTTVDEKGKPVKWAFVRAAYAFDDMGGDAGHESPSGNDSVTAIGGLRPGTYLVAAYHRDFALAGEKISLDEPKQVKSLTLSLKPGVDVPGVATCSDGLPAAGWDVEIKPLWWKGTIFWPSSDVVAEDGTFLLKHVLPGPYQVEIRSLRGPGTMDRSWQTDVNLPPESGLLNLNIPLPSLDGRASIAGTIQFTDGGSYEQEFRICATDAAGNSGYTDIAAGQQSFVIADLVPGLYDLEIEMAGQEKEFENIRAPSEGLVLEVAAPRILPVSGRVVDVQTRRPVTNFELCVVNGWIQGEGLGSESREEREHAYRRISDPNGAFEVRTYGPQCRVLVRADGYGEKASDDLCRAGSTPVVVELEPLVPAKGVVVDEAGRPVAGVTILFLDSSGTDELPVTQTDGEGRFTMSSLPAADDWQWFVFRHPDYARVLKPRASGPDRAAEMKVVLSPGGTVEGCLYDWQGKPLGNTTLNFMDEPQSHPSKGSQAYLGSVTTDNRGFYRIEHLPEELCYVLRENADNQIGVVRAVVMPARGQTRRFDIGGPWKAVGRLLEAGRPVANTQLTAMGSLDVFPGLQAFTMTDADGRFAFYGLPTGHRSIYRAEPGIGPYDQWVSLGSFEFRAGVDLDLGDCEAALAEVTVEVAMEDAAMSSEAWSIILQVYNESNFWGRQIGLLRPRSEPSEPFVFTHVPVGRLVVLARREGFPTVRMPFEVKAQEKTSTVLMTIPTGTAAVSGQVISGKNWSPRGTYSYVLRRADQGVTAEVPVGADGTFHVKNLPAGRYILGWSERTSMVAEVTLGPQEHKTINIDPTQANAARAAEGSLDVLVLAEEGVPLATPSVWLEDAGRVIAPSVDWGESKSFSGDPGLYVLHVEYPGYQPVRTTVQLSPEQTDTMQDTPPPLIITMIRR